MSKLKKVLLQAGYEILEGSVHGKNQTRFTHLLVRKNDKQYFCKVNNTNEVYASHSNESLAKSFKDIPPGIQLLTAVDELEEGDHILHIYPYIDQSPVSNESQQFNDFSVQKSDIDAFLHRVLEAIAYVEHQELVTAYESHRQTPTENTVLALLKKLPKDTPYAVEFLQYLLSEGNNLNEYRLSMTDIQPQNMFWNTSDKTLILCDFEDLSPQKRYYDYAKFCTQLWVVYGRSEYAKRFIVLLFASLPTKDKSTSYSYIRFNMMFELLVNYSVFKDRITRKRIHDMMRWVRKDLLQTVNQTGE